MTSEQLGLELWPRAHDLPPRWDGHLVEWSEWQTPGTVFICPPSPDAGCLRCGTDIPPLVNVGRVWTDPTTTMVASIGRARANRGRHLIGVITAHRCPGCARDTVIVTASGQEWELDATDYTDEGSWDIAT